MTWRTNISLPDEAKEFVEQHAIKLSQLTLLALQERGLKIQKKPTQKGTVNAKSR
jgi:hypothetical protein